MSNLWSFFKSVIEWAAISTMAPWLMVALACLLVAIVIRRAHEHDN